MLSADPNQRWRIVVFTGDRILLPSDAFAYLQSNTVGGTQTVTIPPFSDVAFGEGIQLSFEQLNTAALDIAAGAGVTINSRGALLNANGQFAVLSIIKTASPNTWNLFGDLA